MSKFKVGDRVAVYDGHRRIVGVVEPHEEKGWIYVRYDKPNGTTLSRAYLPQAVRRLKPRRKAREWVLVQNKKTGAVGVLESYGLFYPDAEEKIHVREVLKPKQKKAVLGDSSI